MLLLLVVLLLLSKFRPPILKTLLGVDQSHFFLSWYSVWIDSHDSMGLQYVLWKTCAAVCKASGKCGPNKNNELPSLCQPYKLLISWMSSNFNKTLSVKMSIYHWKQSASVQTNIYLQLTRSDSLE